MTTAHDPHEPEIDDRSDRPTPAEMHRCTVPLEDAEGRIYRICQDAVGADRVVGGGEFPDPSTPPRSPAPGSVEVAEPDEED